MVPVTAFNANLLSLQVSINNGDNWPIGKASSSLGWQPGMAIGKVQLNPVGPAQANVLTVGANSVAITPQGVTEPYQTTLYVPKNMQWINAQLYFYFDTYRSASWILLNQGAYASGGVF